MARMKGQKREQLINDHPKNRLFIKLKELQSSVLAKGQKNPLEATFISSLSICTSSMKFFLLENSGMLGFEPGPAECEVSRLPLCSVYFKLYDLR